MLSSARSNSTGISDKLLKNSLPSAPSKVTDELKDIIASRIKRDGPISFRDFMEMALYYPGLGYYTSGFKRTGKEGDFLTSCTSSPLFGLLIARQIREMWELSGSEQFTIVEYGAGSGELCRAVLDYFKELPGLLPHLKYLVIEKNPAVAQALPQYENVRLVESIADAGEFTGCVLSNELLDNFPVHRVTMRGSLQEILVDHDGHFREVLRPASARLTRYFEDLRVSLPEGFTTEVNLAAEEWLKEIGRQLRRGYVFTIDYGHLAGDFFHMSRSSGTLACYHKHTVHHDPYLAIGAQDITSHVNFSSLALFGMRQGFTLSGYRSQGGFLKALGFFEEMKRHVSMYADPGERIKKENFLSSFLIEDMGSKMKVLVLQKDMPSMTLRGFKE
jgi:SAM-dependent MidA family methyltransferase